MPGPLPSGCPYSLPLPESGRVRLGGLGISRRFEVVQRQLATLPNGLREMQQARASLPLLYSRAWSCAAGTSQPSQPVHAANSGFTQQHTPWGGASS